MRIGQVALDSGVGPSTLRFWEAEGLLPDPVRTPAGYRDYDDTVLDRIAFIRNAQAVGLRLEEIREALELRDAGQAPCDRVRSMLIGRLRDAEQAIAQLHRLRDRMRDLLDDHAEEEWSSEPTEICPIIVSPPEPHAETVASVRRSFASG